ncbi:transmembrane protein 256 homolog [Prorops nasuta]|uniref:transmembrane protein 256 homolog n=1 Tax=Prorops nasuta TaxID=863751 RepID=UPI0034CEBA24
MGIQDALNYAFLTNPISSGLFSAFKYYGTPKATEMKVAPVIPLWRLASEAGPYVRLAGLSGAAAVIFGAYGAHRSYKENLDLKEVFRTASWYHFIHTLVLLGLPLCRARVFVATFMLLGITMFCGSCYYYAFTGEKKYSRITPYGGVCFIIGWLGMLF